VLQLPVTFALRDPAARRDTGILAIGMTLPDGGALTVDWRAGRPGTVGVWSSPQAAAAAAPRATGLVRPGIGPGAAAGPPNARLWRWASQGPRVARPGRPRSR